jgi:alpha/beta superfamily hydrolase
MADKQSLTDRMRDYHPTKTALLWACAGSVALTLIVGFSWGGWVTGATARGMAENATEQGRAQLAATVCVERFMTASDAQAQLASLKAANSWNREGLVSKGGWATLPGMQEPVSDAAEACAERLIKLELPAKKADSAAG